jgi:hypothetical protein
VPLLPGRERLPPRQSDALGAAFGLGDSLPADLFLIGLATFTLLAEAAGAADQPLVCMVDDAHWLDRESLDVLAFVGHRLHVESVVLLFAARGEGQAAGPSPLDGFPQLRLDGLADVAARQLLAATVIAPVADGVAERLLAETGGNPLAIVELARELTPAQLTGDEALPERLPLPERLAAHFLDQVRRLPADTQTLLLVAAAEPSGDAAVLWRAASELGIGRDALLAAQQARLVALGDRVAFRHPLIRSATYLGAPAAERQRVHRALATATGSPQRVERRAAHLAAAAAGPDDTVAGQLEDAAAAARRRGSHAEAVDMLTRSAELTPDPQARARRFLAAARAALAGGAPHRVQPLLDQAWPGLVEGVDRAEAQRVEGLALGMLGRTGGVPELLVAAARTLEPLDVRQARDTWLEAMSAAASPQAGGQPTVVEVAELVLAAPPVPEGPTSSRPPCAAATTGRTGRRSTGWRSACR